MKKFLCLFLTIILVAGLCACGGNGDVRGETPAESTPEFSLGGTNNNTYKNDFLGISCTLPSEWVFYTDEQILELNNIVGDVIDEDIAEQLKNAKIIYDMYVTEPGVGNSINVNMEKLNALQIVGLNIKNTLEAQMDTIRDAYTGMGYTNINIGYQKVTVDGKEFDGMRVTANYQGVNLYLTVFTFLRGSYLANVTVSSLQTDITDTILGYFTVK